MLRITIDLVPFGDDNRSRTLSQFVIYNTGREGDDPAQYLYEVAADTGYPHRPLCSFSHYRGDGLHTCVSLALNALCDAGYESTVLPVDKSKTL